MLRALGRVPAVSAVCTGRCSRSVLAGRRILVDSSRAALASVPGRELTLACDFHEVPQRATSLALDVDGA